MGLPLGTTILTNPQKTLTNHFNHLLLNSFCIQIGFQRGKKRTHFIFVSNSTGRNRDTQWVQSLYKIPLEHNYSCVQKSIESWSVWSGVALGGVGVSLQ